MKREREDQSRNGVRVVVWRDDSGSVVEASCDCFGHPQRSHSNYLCPLLQRQLLERAAGA